ncbi:MAG: hypothetical protein LBI26_00265 [Holosporales bacterium]|nr:hypothetical protein [Holosporales bacterium]
MFNHRFFSLLFCILTINLSVARSSFLPQYQSGQNRSQTAQQKFATQYQSGQNRSQTEQQKFAMAQYQSEQIRIQKEQLAKSMGKGENEILKKGKSGLEGVIKSAEKGAVKVLSDVLNNIIDSSGSQSAPGAKNFLNGFSPTIQLPRSFMPTTNKQPPIGYYPPNQSYRENTPSYKQPFSSPYPQKKGTMIPGKTYENKNYGPIKVVSLPNSSNKQPPKTMIYNGSSGRSATNIRQTSYTPSSSQRYAGTKTVQLPRRYYS